MGFKTMNPDGVVTEEQDQLWLHNRDVCNCWVRLSRDVLTRTSIPAVCSAWSELIGQEVCLNTEVTVTVTQFTCEDKQGDDVFMAVYYDDSCNKLSACIGNIYDLEMVNSILRHGHVTCNADGGIVRGVNLETYASAIIRLTGDIQDDWFQVSVNGKSVMLSPIFNFEEFSNPGILEPMLKDNYGDMDVVEQCANQIKDEQTKRTYYDGLYYFFAR